MKFLFNFYNIFGCFNHISIINKSILIWVNRWSDCYQYIKIAKQTNSNLRKPNLMRNQVFRLYNFIIIFLQTPQEAAWPRPIWPLPHQLPKGQTAESVQNPEEHTLNIYNHDKGFSNRFIIEKICQQSEQIQN